MNARSFQFLACAVVGYIVGKQLNDAYQNYRMRKIVMQAVKTLQPVTD